MVTQPGNTRLGKSCASGELRYAECVVVRAEGAQQCADAGGCRHIVVPLIGTHALSVPHQRGSVTPRHCDPKEASTWVHRVPWSRSAVPATSAPTCWRNCGTAGGSTCVTWWESIPNRRG